MNGPNGFFPRRYYVDKSGRRVLVGLTIEETLEFEKLDNLTALDEADEDVVWTFDGLPATTEEKRWRELYMKHEEAWKAWRAKTDAARPPS